MDTGIPPQSSMQPRAHLQSALTLVLALLILAVGWAGVTDAPWWRALGVEPEVWWHLVPLALIAGVMLLRIRRPVTALVLGSCCVLIDLSIGFNLGILLCLSDLVYSLGIRAARGTVRATAVTFAGVSLMTAAALMLGGADTQSALGLALGMAAVLLVPLWWAIEVRRGFPLWQEADARGHLEAERHSALLQAQTRKRKEAVEEERRRMARELHDVVSSQVSAIALTSGAVLNAEPETQRDRQALQTIRTTSIEALEELRDMVQLLRGEAAPPSDALADTSWDAVLERATAHGLDVTVEGKPPEGMTSAATQVVLRVLQESLTNALKHGNGTAHISLRPRRRTVLLSIASGLAGEEDSPPRSAPGSIEHLGSGTGLFAMRERVQLTGGQFRAGREQNHWLVEAEIPVRKEPPHAG